MLTLCKAHGVQQLMKSWLQAYNTFAIREAKKQIEGDRLSDFSKVTINIIKAGSEPQASSQSLQSNNQGTLLPNWISASEQLPWQQSWGCVGCDCGDTERAKLLSIGQRAGGSSPGGLVLWRGGVGGGDVEQDGSAGPSFMEPAGHRIAFSFPPWNSWSAVSIFPRACLCHVPIQLCASYHI